MPTLQVRLEERDYVNAARSAARPSMRTIILLVVASALVVVGAVVGWRAGYMREAFIAGFVWLFGLAGAGIGHMLSIAPKARRVFRQQRGLQRPHEVSWNDVGVTITGEGGQSTIAWTDFYKFRHSPNTPHGGFTRRAASARKVGRQPHFVARSKVKKRSIPCFCCVEAAIEA